MKKHYHQGDTGPADPPTTTPEGEPVYLRPIDPGEDPVKPLQ